MAWPTHYYQMVGLVWAFRAAGHEVTVAGHPSVADAATKTGVIAVCAGGNYDYVEGIRSLVQSRKRLADELNMGEHDPFPASAFEKIHELRMGPHIKTAEDLAEDLATFARKWRPHLVIADPMVYAAPIAAGVAGAPLVRHLWGPDMCRHIGLPGSGVDEDDYRAVWPKGLIDLYAAYGVKPAADVAACTLDTCPASMQLPGTRNRIAMRYTAYNGVSEVPSWLLEPTERPRVCVTWGSVATALLGSEAFLVPRILKALDGLGVDVVVAIRSADRERLGDVPDGMRVVESMPLDLILPTCSAIIHQSGAGTTLSAALFGVPQVTLPQVADQGLVSAQLSGTGAGIGLAADEADTNAIRDATSRTLHTAEPRDAAARLREEILAQPTPAKVIKALEELI
ncbi:MAG TPA: nucleotide disphospho-sugar-binding domain-containing protein [Streptosporangiaceae bacterium]